MKKLGLSKVAAIAIAVVVVVAAVAGAFILLGQGMGGGGKVRLVYMTAGDINMLALAQNLIAPEFEKKYPNVEVITVHTGPGEAGSRTVFEKIKAARDAGKACWDVDVAVVHQIFLSWAIPEDLLMKYTDEVETSKYVTAEDAKIALGVNVEGYVMPMFHSQIAIAYNPQYVKDPPKSFEELVEWVKQNPGKFGYNGIKGGMSGVGFTVAWVYWKTGEYEKFTRGPYDPALKDKIVAALEELKEFNKYVTITSGNVGTLDMLNRGEIWMGPVWVDMFYTFMLEGKMDPNIRLTLIDPGLPGQPMYYVIPKKACNPEWAKKLVEFMTSPEIQAKVIVERYNWYPGIDAKYVMDYVSPEAKNRLFKDIGPEDLAKYGKMFPIAEYFGDILKLYEQVVIGG